MEKRLKDMELSRRSITFGQNSFIHRSLESGGYWACPSWFKSKCISLVWSPLLFLRDMGKNNAAQFIISNSGKKVNTLIT